MIGKLREYENLILTSYQNLITHSVSICWQLTSCLSLFFEIGVKARHKIQRMGKREERREGEIDTNKDVTE